MSTSLIAAWALMGPPCALLIGAAYVEIFLALRQGYREMRGKRT